MVYNVVMNVFLVINGAPIKMLLRSAQSAQPSVLVLTTQSCVRMCNFSPKSPASSIMILSCLMDMCLIMVPAVQARSSIVSVAGMVDLLKLQMIDTPLLFARTSQTKLSSLGKPAPVYHQNISTSGRRHFVSICHIRMVKNIQSVKMERPG